MTRQTKPKEQVTTMWIEENQKDNWTTKNELAKEYVTKKEQTIKRKPMVAAIPEKMPYGEENVGKDIVSETPVSA